MIDKSHLYISVMEGAPAKPTGSGAMTLVDEILLVLYLLGLAQHNGALRLQRAMSVTKKCSRLDSGTAGASSSFCNPARLGTGLSSHHRAKE